MRLARVGCALLACCIAACGGSLEIRHLASGGPTTPVSLAALHSSLGESTPPEAAREPAIAIGSDATALWGLRLDGAEESERPWRYEAKVTQPPVVDRALTVFGNGPLLE